MTTTINAYISFDANTREAMNYYKEIIGGELNIMIVGESPIASQCPAAMQNQVLHSTLIKNGVLLVMGSDMVAPGADLLKGNNIALSINCSSEEEINSFYSKFAADGKIIDDLKTQFWGAFFLVFTYKLGIRLMFNYYKTK